MMFELTVLTVTIAAIVAIVTYGQWSTARNQLKLSLFEKRYETYEKMTGFVAEILTTDRVAPGADIEFLRETKRAHFLFSGDERVEKLISEIYSNAVNLHTLEAVLEGLNGDGRKKISKINV